LDLIIDISIELWSAVIGFVEPFALQNILSALEDGSGKKRSTAYFWALATFASHLSFAQLDVFQKWHTRRCYERTRGQLFCAIHHKSLKRQDVSGKVSHEDDEEGNADLGKILNLMQLVSSLIVDGSRTLIRILLGATHTLCLNVSGSSLLSLHLQFGLSLLLLSCTSMFFLSFIPSLLMSRGRVLGWSALSGVAVVLVAYILNYPLAKYNIYVRDGLLVDCSIDLSLKT
jgi:hypothetical protein